MRGHFRLLGALFALSLLSACMMEPVPYVWGSYEQKLYDFYRDPNKMDEHLIALEALADAEAEDIFDFSEAVELLDKATNSAEKHAIVKGVATSPKARSSQNITRVAPGLYAEIGYLYFEKNNLAKAIRFFEREKRSWPESAYFMDVMISLAKGGGKLKPPSGDKTRGNTGKPTS
jgi:hypothetical protein